MHGRQIINSTITQEKLILSTPVNSNDAATKSFVEEQVEEADNYTLTTELSDI